MEVVSVVPGTGRETKRLCPRGKLFSKIAVLLQVFNILSSAVEARLPSLAQGAASSRSVAIANRIEARTASKFGAQFWSSEGDFPPRKKDMLPPWVQDEEVRQTSIISTDIGNGGMAVKEHEAGNVFASVSASEGLNDFGKS
ncbi:hypothetical protein PCH_Pc23g00710 [Penicillium rubens Wisconsin 54-1255]|uniref:Uncharacterized protein n=1 Tax=Penicillium rubens (strain ATCC 28089 / DSM 1075 / NRRL 1951 / Wisconsin 54-1255) TaxID=500485 RepID=B6HWC1_PENRW|nr:hypothetical protein PCH_Pc23g00710 [Penicillium rubens Wisconsin 54-1255]